MNLYAFMHFMHLNCHASASYVHFFNCGLGISGLIKRCICCCCRWWWCWWWWWWCWWWWCWWWKRTRAHTGSAETRVHALLWPGHVKFRQRCICWGIDRRCRLGALEHVCLLVSPGEVGGGRGTVGGGQGGDEMPGSCYLWIPLPWTWLAVGTVPVGLSTFILGDGGDGEINKKKANSRGGGICWNTVQFCGKIQNFGVIFIGVSFRELVVENEASDIGFVTKIIMRLQYIVYNT